MQMQDQEFISKMNQMWNEGRPEMMDELFDPSWKSHTAMPGFEDMEGQKRFMRMFMAGFSDMHWDVPSFMRDGDMYAFRFEGEGRHTGEFMGVAATNKRVCMGGTTIARMRNGKIVESWDYFDAMGLMMQLGAMQMPMGMSGMGEGAMGGREAA